MRTARRLLPALLLAVTVFTVPALRAQTESPAARDQRMAWFRNARFGLCIHWGVYSVPAGEWQGRTDHGEWIMETGKIPVSEYEQFARQFNPVKFNARAWVRLAKGTTGRGNTQDQRGRHPFSRLLHDRVPR